jgi:hypothetical protein
MTIATIDQLITKVRECLDGIDRTQDDSRGGYWQTADGAKVGRIILYGLEQMLRANWPDPAAAPEQATEPLPRPTYVGFEFEVRDLDYCVQATGSAPTYVQVLSEGRRYLAQYLQDGPHTLEIRRVETFDPDDVIPAVTSDERNPQP